MAKKKPVVPMSELAHKITDDWTAQQCVEELQRIAKAHPDNVISRNFFRVHSKIAESVWNRHYGTFTEFRRQAGLVLSRQQHQHERNIAKHASVDHYRDMNEEKAQWGEAYLRDNGKRYKTILACSDLHDKECDPFQLRVMIDTAKRANVDIISLVGDVFDLPEFGKYTVDPREWDVVGRIKAVHENILRPFREACPDAQIDLIEGNHEARMLRQLADATPALRSVLADLHGMTIGKLLGLEAFEVNYIAKADLAAFTKRDVEKEVANNYKIYFESFMAHHFPYARNMGLPGVNGHHHQHVVWSQFSPVYGAYEWHQMGCGHVRSASYCEGEKWHNGFCLVHIDTDTRSVNIEYVPITDFAVVGGKFYYREPSESVNGKKILLSV